MIIKGTNNIDTLDGTSDADSIYGYAGEDVLMGGAGNDLLDGGIDFDLLYGGAGNDTYIVDSDDMVSEDDGFGGDSGGVDLVRAYANYHLGDYVENLTLLGSSTNGVGNALNNIIKANANGCQLLGEEGDDSLVGGNGNDELSGSAGNDSLQGGNGDLA